MWSIPDTFRVRLGGNVYQDVTNLVEYKGEALFTLKRTDEGYLGIYFEIHDASGAKIATVRRNEIYPTKDEPGRFKLDGTADRCVLRDTTDGRTLCDIRKRAAAEGVELDVAVDTYAPDGVHLELTPEQTNLPGITIRGNTIVRCRTGIKVA